MAAQKSWKNMGMLADVADGGRSRKWGCRGRLALGYVYLDFKDFIYLFLEREERKEKERERNFSVWLPLTWPPLGTWPAA